MTSEEQRHAAWIKSMEMQGPTIPLEKPALMGIFRLGWMTFLARFRLSKKAVCVMSSDQGVVDFHDYPDTGSGQPFHCGTDFCKRCGKEFTM